MREVSPKVNRRATRAQTRQKAEKKENETGDLTVSVGVQDSVTTDQMLQISNGSLLPQVPTPL